MSPEQFEQILDKVTHKLTDQAQNGLPARNSKDFENQVLVTLRETVETSKARANPSFHRHAFPDIVVNGFGVEVKHTIKDSWLTVGNSIFEGMRDDEARSIYIIYGKMGGWPEVRWQKYENCVTHVRISHAPRFVIEMDRAGRFFDTINIAYSDFCQFASGTKDGVRKTIRTKSFERG